MGKNKNLEAGEVVLINKPTEPQSIAPTTLERQRPKKELSEKQKESLQKLIERNKQKAQERRSVVTNNIPEAIPEDKVAVVVKPKRKYTRTKPAWNSNQSAPKEVSKKEKTIDYTPSPTPVETEEESEESESSYEPPPKPKRVSKKKVAKKVSRKKYYASETSDTTNNESSSSESEMDEKYVRKAQARLKAVQEIDSRIKTMANPYHARGMSIF
jgi:hypothetical protein